MVKKRRKIKKKKVRRQIKDGGNMERRYYDHFTYLPLLDVYRLRLDLPVRYDIIVSCYAPCPILCPNFILESLFLLAVQKHGGTEGANKRLHLYFDLLPQLRSHEHERIKASKTLGPVIRDFSSF